MSRMIFPLRKLDVLFYRGETDYFKSIFENLPREASEKLKLNSHANNKLDESKRLTICQSFC